MLIVDIGHSGHVAGDFELTRRMALVVRAFLDEPSKPKYGFELMEPLGISSGTLYPMLARLERQGWIEGQREDIDPSVAGRPPRRNYRLTGEGLVLARNALAELSSQLRPPQTVRIRPVISGGL
jgi:DNA-binding PadR family transcriptional regulator